MNQIIQNKVEGPGSNEVIGIDTSKINDLLDKSNEKCLNIQNDSIIERNIVEIDIQLTESITLENVDGSYEPQSNSDSRRSSGSEFIMYILLSELFDEDFDISAFDDYHINNSEESDEISPFITHNSSLTDLVNAIPPQELDYSDTNSDVISLYQFRIESIQNLY
mmetsp:Transcript_7788/g.6961  ORF Transcript_7788/g.6961 Transcript_7788/m.6961 type:complete len:165 (+) Transcript_7788:94-588(+)